MSSYEFPFNERIRTFLRLEDLFTKVLHHVSVGHQYSHHAALVSLLQMLDLIDRADLKVDLLQELDRSKVQLSCLLGNPGIDQQALHHTLHQLERCAQTMRSDNLKLGQTLRENDWLMSVKQRTSIPGGVCEFDLPSYHHWLHLSADKRQSDLNTWLARLMPMHDSIALILQLLRGSGHTTAAQAINGAFQQQLTGNKPAQLLRIEVPEGDCFPEVSANKYAINIRFHRLDFVQKPKLCEEPIHFNMVICNFAGSFN